MRRYIWVFVYLLVGASGYSPALAGPGPRSGPIHRHKPTAGNYVHVYRYYRGHSRQHNGLVASLARLFQHRPGGQTGALCAITGRAHRTL